jgi:hypothetical protein
MYFEEANFNVMDWFYVAQGEIPMAGLSEKVMKYLSPQMAGNVLVF